MEKPEKKSVPLSGKITPSLCRALLKFATDNGRSKNWAVNYLLEMALKMGTKKGTNLADHLKRLKIRLKIKP